MIKIVIILLSIGVCVLVYRHDKKKEREDMRLERIRQRNREKEREELESEFGRQRADVESRFGAISFDVNLDDSEDYDIKTHVMFFETSKVVVIRSKAYKFADILGISLVDDATNETITTSVGNVKTSTGSMLGRAVVGGVLTGGLGAVAGAATAKKSISTDATSATVTRHDYVLYVNIDNLEKPVIVLDIGSDSMKAQELAGIFNVIIARNKQALA